MSAIDRLIETATAEEGYLEKASNSQLDSKTANAGDNNFTKYARDLDALGIYNSKKNGYSWCDVFVDWCFITTFGVELGMKLLCQPCGGAGASCTSSVSYYKQHGQFHGDDPEPGDQIFFTNDGGKTSCHTGLVTRVADGKVYTVEGNTSSAYGVVSNGGCVREKSYNLSYGRIYGYGRPDWSLITETEDEDMDVNRFKELWTEMRKELQDNDQESWEKEGCDWCIKNGIMAGGGTGSDGQPNYMYHDLLTRGQMCVMLYRFAKLMGEA